MHHAYTNCPPCPNQYKSQDLNAHLNKYDFKLFFKTLTLQLCFNDKGNWFHNLGATTKKALYHMLYWLEVPWGETQLWNAGSEQGCTLVALMSDRQDAFHVSSCKPRVTLHTGIYIQWVANEDLPTGVFLLFLHYSCCTVLKVKQSICQ